MCDLAAEMEEAVRAELAGRLADVSVAPSPASFALWLPTRWRSPRPILQRSPALREADLLALARNRGSGSPPGHLQPPGPDRSHFGRDRRTRRRHHPRRAFGEWPRAPLTPLQRGGGRPRQRQRRPARRRGQPARTCRQTCSTRCISWSRPSFVRRSPSATPRSTRPRWKRRWRWAANGWRTATAPCRPTMTRRRRMCGR